MRAVLIMCITMGLPFVGCIDPPSSPCPLAKDEPSAPCTPQVYYQVSQGQQAPLSVDTSRVAVLAPDGLGPQSADALAAVGICVGELNAHGLPGWYYAPVPSGRANACGIEEIVATMAAGDGFDFVSPVFAGPMFVTPELIVSFNENLSAGEAQQILDQAQAGVITRTFSTDPLVYIARSPARSGFAALDAAKRLREQPTVRFAEPNMIWTARSD